MSSYGSKVKKSKWSLIGGLITLGYLGAIIALAWQNKTSIKDQTASLALNELADTLSGAFAPLAFLWLFVVTMIQGQELHDTRKVMSEQADAAEKQAASASLQVAHMGKQVAALAEQNRVAAEVASANYQLALYERRAELYSDLDAAEFSIVQNGDLSSDVRKQLKRAVNKGRWIVGPATRDWLFEISNSADSVAQLRYRMTAHGCQLARLFRRLLTRSAFAQSH